MREMKDSHNKWCGNIPVSWNMIPYKRLFKIYSGATPKSDEPENWDGDICWVTPADYKTEDVYVSCGKRNLTQKGYDSCSAIIVPKNSIIISKRAPIGTVAISKNDLATNQGCLACVPNSNMDAKYGYYVTSAAKEELELRGSGTTFLEISANAFANMPIPVPSVNEQNAIVAFLDENCAKIADAITRHKQIIEKLEEYKRSVITHAVTKGLNPDVEMKNSGVEWVGTIPEQWQTIKLKFVTTIRNEKGHFNPKTDKYVGLENIEGYSGRYIETATQYTEAEYNICKKGDIVFNKLRPYLTKAMEIPFDCFCTNELIVFSSFEGNSKYLLYLLLSDSFIDNVNASTYGAKMPRANPDFVRNIEIPIPSKSEQNTIVLYLDNMCKKIDEAITRQKAAIEKLEEYRKSIIYNAVT
ncbi:MAG: restriction endonuclease subunit S, partial [Bacillota bacterium]|nr:restriction endonuclease subunit S [Bacillota bacterium]